MKYYLTTPLYYVNAAPHIGHTYTTLAADTIKRVRHMKGDDAVLFTGTDEHGQKVERSAKAAGKSPREFTDVIAAEFMNQWDTLGIRYDKSMRTTDPRHHKTVQWLFQRCLDRGYVYKGQYQGQYCVSCELYVNDAKPGDPCPDCGRPTETVTEDNYFFKLSEFGDRLLALYEENPRFVQPETRRNEVMAFVKQGLQDLSISRTTIKWGIPLPVEGHHVFYVWFDALIGYISGVGYLGQDSEGAKWWPADLHLIGKEILRFHAVFWPAFLMAADVPLPKQVYAHGWLLFENDKMSKSRGNMLRAEPIRQVVGLDGLRYFLLREIVFGQDGSFSYDALIQRYNSDLANGLGNLASRTLTMIQQYRGGVIPAGEGDAQVRETAQAVLSAVPAAYEEFAFSRALEKVWELISAADKFIVERAPWKLARQEGAEAQALLDSTLYTSAEVLRLVTALLAPVLPESAAKIWSQLGMPAALDQLTFESLQFGGLPANQKIGEIAGVFPRIEAKTAIPRMQDLEGQETVRQAALLGKTIEVPKAEVKPEEDGSGFISIDDFAKVDLRVGIVRSAEPVKNADKLVHMKIDVGEPALRTIVAGIASSYTPEQLVGRKVVIVANLQPRKLRGITSQGMVVAASLPGDKSALATFLEDVEPGSRLR